MPDRASHMLFLRWLIFVGVVAVGALVVWSQGFFYVLYKYDKSHLSLLILVLLIAATIHAGYLIKRLANQLDQANALRDLLLKRSDSSVAVLQNHINVGDTTLPMDSTLIHHLQIFENADPEHHGPSTSSLLEALAIKLRSPQRSGWMMADLLIKLGLLGTVIGFIYMLYSMESFDAVDISTVQNVLIDMSSGMRVALFTTLSGLTGGIIAGIQYQMADRGADELVATLMEVSALQLSRMGKSRV